MIRKFKQGLHGASGLVTKSGAELWLKLRNRLARVPSARRAYRRAIAIWSGLQRKQHLLRGRICRTRWERRYIQESGLFDCEWYLAQYGGEMSKYDDPISHFLRKGSGLGFRPNLLFHTRWYKDSYPEVASTGISPLGHYIRFGANEGRNPNPLFDSAWYLRVYPDIRSAQINPLLHYMRHGVAEGRDPCALFSTRWYLSQYRDVAEAGLNPLQHYLEAGAYEGRDPNPFFSSAWYLTRYSDVSRAKLNPLVHYINTGWREGRQPSPRFDGLKYLEIYQDVADAGIDPLEHYLVRGVHEQRQQPGHFYPVASLAPAVGTPTFDHLDLPVVDVIIPVYRGVDETRRCIESVFTARCQTEMRVVVINDCSPEQEMYVYLAAAKQRFGFEYIINEENLGFVRTVNKAMSLCHQNDVLLLNSDTEVSAEWLDRIADQAYASADIATVTPLSNNATICSYPDFSGRRELSPGMTLADMNAACWIANAGCSVEVPTGVGFCMYIKRNWLDMLGLFDADAFGKGYGEENDFCMRVIEQGGRNILAMDTFVFHAGEVSFAAGSKAGKQRGMEALLAKHPDYLLRVASHFAHDPGAAYRAAINCQLWRESDKPVVLLVTHNLGGGTERHVVELANRYAGSAQVLILRPAGSSATYGVSLQALDDYAPFALNLDMSGEDAFARLIAALPVSRIHIHHLLGYPEALERAIRHCSIPFDFTVHDYYSICPQVNLSKDGVHYCGEPDAAGCNACIRSKPRDGARDIRSWRMANEWVLRDARRVFAPSEDAAHRILNYAPDARVVSVYHQEGKEHWGKAAPLRRLGPDDILRVVILGVLAPHKGRQLVLDAAIEAVSQQLPIEFIVIGDPFGSLPPRSVAAICATGRYKEEDLPQLLASFRPDLVLFASQWPETYSYTLTAALDAGLPVLVPNLGAFPERVAGRPWTFTFDWRADGRQLAALIARLRSDHYLAGSPPALSLLSPASSALGPDDGYLEHPLSIEEKPSEGLSILVVLEYEGEIPSPCAHIRLVSFLSAMQSLGKTSVRYVRAADLDYYHADVVVTQRVPVRTEPEAEALLRSARERGIPVIYDLDDNLFELDPDAEGGKYRPLLGVVSALSRGADEVWVSTRALADDLLGRGIQRVRVQRNQLDPVLWQDVLQLAVRGLRSGKPARLLCMGTRTHADDFALIEPALRDLKRKYGNAVEICMIGVRPSDADLDGLLTTISPPASVGASYPAFVSWIATLPPFDIGLSPLQENAFNRCKSEIKFLDYCALGLVPVLSDLEPYRDLITDGLTGYLVPSDAASWFVVLDKLLGGPDAGAAVAAQGRKRDFVGDFNRGVQERIDSIEALVLQTEAKASSPQVYGCNGSSAR